MIPVKFEKLVQLKGHTGSIYALEKGNAPHRFFSAGADNLIVCWNLQTPEAGELIAKTSSIVYSLRFIMHQNILLAGTSSGGIHVFDLDTRKELRLLQFHHSGIFDVRYSVKNNLLAIASADGAISFCALNDFSLLKQVKLCDQKIRSIAFSEDETRLAIGCGDGSIVFADAQNLNVTGRLQAHKEGWSCHVVKFEGNNLLLSGGRDAILNVIEIKEDYFSQDISNILAIKISQAIPAHNYAIYDIQFSPGHDYFATCSRDKSIKIWDAKTFQFVQKPGAEKSYGHINSVNKLLWSDYKDYLVSASDDRSIIVWEKK